MGVTALLQSALAFTPLSVVQATYSAKENVLGTINSAAYNNTIKKCLIKRNLHLLFNPKQSHLLKTIQNNNSLANYSNSSVFQTSWPRKAFYLASSLGLITIVFK